MRRLGFVLLLLDAACGPKEPRTPPPETLELTPVAFTALTGWADDDQAAALPALQRSCARLMRQTDERAVGPDGLAGTVADWRAPCAAVAQASPSAAGAQATPSDRSAARALLETWFAP